MRMGQKLWIFYYWPIFVQMRFFLTETLEKRFIPQKKALKHRIIEIYMNVVIKISG